MQIDKPASYFCISTSQSCSTCALSTGSTLAKIGWTKVNRWSWERCKASDINAYDAFIK